MMRGLGPADQGSYVFSASRTTGALDGPGERNAVPSQWGPNSTVMEIDPAGEFSKCQALVDHSRKSPVIRWQWIGADSRVNRSLFQGTVLPDIEAARLFYKSGCPVKQKPLLTVSG